jgi:DNA-binding beta-propeller fold protein YncE
MYTFGQVGDVLYEYNFAGDPFDLYGIEYVQSVALLNSVGASITVPADLWLSNDGSNVYLLNSSDDTLYQYSLSTPWDLSTLTSYGNLVVGTEDSTPFGFAFSSDGFTLYYVGGTKDRLIKYTLTTAWDITTATFSLESTGRIYTDRENINLQIGTPSVIIDYEDKEFYSTNYNHITKYKIIEKTV